MEWSKESSSIQDARKTEQPHAKDKNQAYEC